MVVRNGHGMLGPDLLDVLATEGTVDGTNSPGW